jgi:hypothetical protein
MVSLTISGFDKREGNYEFSVEEEKGDLNIKK